LLVMAVDNLPCELPFDSSREFGNALAPFVPALARCDFGRPLDELELPGPVRRALILHRGRLTPEFEYIGRFLERSL
jgi:alpha-aminoadipic semialdehyde synthase